MLTNKHYINILKLFLIVRTNCSLQNPINPVPPVTKILTIITILENTLNSFFIKPIVILSNVLFSSADILFLLFRFPM